MPPFFDPLLAKAIVWRPSRDEAIAGLAQALAETRLYGVETNRQYLQQILSFAPFTAGEPLDSLSGAVALPGRYRGGSERRHPDQRP